MSTSQHSDGLPLWAGLSLETLRNAGVSAASAQAEPGLNPEAEAVARGLSHPRLNPAAILLAVRVSDLLMLWIGGMMGQVMLLPLDAQGVREASLSAFGLALATLAALSLTRAYRLRALRGFGEGWLRALPAAAGPVVLAALAGVWGEASAAVGAAVLAGQGGALAVQRFAVSRFVAWALDAHVTERRAAIVGGGGNAERLIRGLEAQPDNDIRIVALFDDRGDDRSPPLVAGCRKLGTVAELLAFARIADLDMLIVTLPLSAETRILSLLKALWVLPVDIRLSAYSSDFAFPRRPGEGVPGLIGVLDNPLPGMRRLLKRVFDLAVASAALIALSPVMLLTALAIRLESPGPVLFMQKRHGFNHRPVDVWKFRSMYQGDCDPLARSIVTKGDPRVTRVGRFIRKTSIDELPQLFNVLMGDLSLVGPRPHAVHARSSRQQMFTEIVEGYSGRHRVPPGITGWAQINGWRGEIDDPEKLRQRFEHDLYYIENWSFWLDLKILLMTPLRLLDVRNAY